jgi:PAS domain S-box-containing protein
MRSRRAVCHTVGVSGQQSQKDLRSALEALDEPFFWMSAVRDPTGCVVDFTYEYCNRAALELLGRRREEVVGRRLLELFPSHLTNGLFDAYARVTETGEPLRYEFAFDEGGVAGEFEVVVSRVGDGYVLAGHDIGERKRLERAQERLAVRHKPPGELVSEHARLSRDYDLGLITHADFTQARNRLLGGGHRPVNIPPPDGAEV